MHSSIVLTAPDSFASRSSFSCSVASFLSRVPLPCTR
jgi:hypothetical protein